MLLSSHIDWISVVIKSRSRKPKLEDNVPVEVRHNSSWEVARGKMGYTDAIKFDNGVLVMENKSHPRMGVYVLYTGKALVNVLDDVPSILMSHIESGHSISRIDLAIDAIDSGLVIGDLAELYRNGMCITNSKSATYIDSLSENGDTLYIGSMKSRKKLMRIYNKGLQMGLDSDWKRIETQFMRPSSNVVARMVLDDFDNESGTFQAIMKGFADFNTHDVWLRIMNAESIPIRVQSVDGDTNTRKYLMDVVSKMIAREVVNDTHFADRLNARITYEISKLEIKK